MKPTEMTDEQLITAVAEKVMGWKEEIRSVDINGLWRKARIWIKLNGDYIGWGEFDPINDPRYLMMVVERMDKLGWSYHSNSNLWGTPKWEIVFVRYLETIGEVLSGKSANDIIGRAVCEAALAAVEGEDER